MSKAILSVVILFITIIVSIILYNVVVKNYGDWGTFENWLFMGLVTFFLCLGVFVAALLMESYLKQNK